MNSFIRLMVISILIVGGFSACTAYKDVTYMDGANQLTGQTLEGKNQILTPKIMPKDKLQIIVSIPGNEEAVAPFNLTVPSTLGASTRNTLTTQPVLQDYIVDEKGMIDFPKLGRLKVAGLTKSETEQLLKKRMIKYITEEPIVTVRFVNFHVSVLGEVKHPGSFIIKDERVSILEALALAGDLTIYGKRNNVLLVREDEQSVKKYVNINLKDKYLVTSPYYYLQQNDVLYVQPNRSKGNASAISSGESMMISGVSILISVANLLINILN